MVDTFTKDQRSDVMRAVKSQGNKSTEIQLTRIFRQRQIHGWKRNYKLFGAPDFVFIQKRIAVFTDGCFWHGHNCRNLTPAFNEQYWVKKITRNRKRDKLVKAVLVSKGWHVIRVWECEIKKENRQFLRKLSGLA